MLSTQQRAADEIDRLRADLNAAKTALENQIAHTTEIANLCARQRAWIDGVMAQDVVAWIGESPDKAIIDATCRKFVRDDYERFGRNITELITRPAPFEDK